MKPKPPGCMGCPAAEVGLSFVPGVGPHDAKIALIGQGPGADEAYLGSPFVGRSGQMLDSWIARAGLYRHQLWIGNIVQCQMPGNRPPRADEVAHCRAAYWGPVVDQLPNLKVVVPVGVPAMQALVDPKADSDWSGYVRRVDVGTDRSKEVYIIPVLHPAGIMRGNWASEPFQILCLKRARTIAERGSWPTDDPRSPPPGALLQPTLKEVEDWIAGVGPQGVSVDIETAGRHIVMVGMCRVADLVPICIHFLTQGGQPYWAPQPWALVEHALASILADPNVPKVFHNGQSFDVPILEANGFKVEGYLWDTLLMQHIAYAEMEKGLEHCARLYCGINPWKWTLDSDAGGEWK